MIYKFFLLSILAGQTLAVENVPIQSLRQKLVSAVKQTLSNYTALPQVIDCYSGSTFTGTCNDDETCCVVNGSYDCCSSDDSNTCFSSTDTVQMENGATKYISDLVVGDRVLSWDNVNSKPTYTDVVYLPHAKNDIESTFVNVEVASGSSLKMTQSHLILAGDCAAPSSSFALKASASLTTGECVQSVDGVVAIKSISKVKDIGIYTFVTNDEFVVVNGIVASPFAVNHFVVNKFYNIHRAIYAVSPALLTSTGASCLTTGIGAAAFGAYTMATSIQV